MSAEQERLIGSVIIFGVITAIDPEQALVQVKADGLETDWLRWMTSRAGPNRDWHPPEVGAQVIIACPYGDPSQGIVLGSIYQDAHPAPSDTIEKDRAAFSDGASVEYDRETHTFTLDIPTEGIVNINCQNANVTATEKIRLDTPLTEVTGDIECAGKITAQLNIETPAEVKAGAIGLKAHHHMEQGDGAPTSASLA